MVLSYNAFVVLCVTWSLVHGGVVKRSDDASPLLAVVQKLTSDLTALQATVAARDADIQALKQDLQTLKDDNKYPVAFTAHMANHSVSETALHPVIRFREVVTNTGHAYSYREGAFIAPYDGDYMFIVSVDVSTYYDALSIHKNGRSVVEGNNDGGHGTHIVASCVIALTSGDVVTVNHSGNEIKGSVGGGSKSVFVGFRIR